MVTPGTIYVLAPVHNRRAVTERFVRCLATQTDQAFHLVLADDGSTDGTADMVRSIIPAATILQGSGHWWWAGSLEQARRWLFGRPANPGDLVLIINDDTTFEPDFLAAGRVAMQAPGRFILLAQPFSMQTGALVALGIKADWRRLSFLPALRPEDIGCFSTRGLFMHRGDFEGLGGFHTGLLPHYLSDYELTIRASRRGFHLRTDPTVRLVMDESTTGTRALDIRSPLAYFRSVLSIRATKNPLYWSSFVLLASPRRLIVPNLARVWWRFLRGLLRSVLRSFRSVVQAGPRGIVAAARAWPIHRARGAVLRRVRKRADLRLEKIGTPYGGWVVPTALIGPDWRCYCAGVGEDVSFDLGVIERFGCEVFAFDPTPRAVAFVQTFADTQPRFHFMPVGLWSSDTTLRFYAPRNPAHVSHSIVNLQGTSEWFEASVRTVPSLLRELGHESIDLLKLDIEGAEHTVIASVLEAGIRPRVVCFEIDQPVGVLRFLRTIRRVMSHGYALVAVDGWNYTFVRR